MRVLQRFAMRQPGGDLLSVTFSRFPNGGGVIDRVVRITWVSDEGEQRRDITAELTQKLTQEIELVAAEEWDGYWTCDPRTAREWVAWALAQPSQAPQASGPAKPERKRQAR